MPFYKLSSERSALAEPLSGQLYTGNHDNLQITITSKEAFPVPALLLASTLYCPSSLLLILLLHSIASKVSVTSPDEEKGTVSRDQENWLGPGSGRASSDSCISSD